MSWTPFGVAFEIEASLVSVSRTSATQARVTIKAHWETYYSGAQTNYGMTATASGTSVTLNPFGTKASSGTGNIVATVNCTKNVSSTISLPVVFKNFNTDNGDSATKTVYVSVTIPAWLSYTVKYNANGGTGAPSSQTKWSGQTLTLSSMKPTRTGYTFKGWATSASGSVAYYAGGAYTANAAVTLYAVWQANTYTVTYDANGGSGAPSQQTKTYGVALTLSSTIPTRTNYKFMGWAASESATTATYAAGGSYTQNAAVTLYAVWRVDYAKPRITNLSVYRVNDECVEDSSGTFVYLYFDWETDYANPTVNLTWTPETDGSSSDEWVAGGSGATSGNSGRFMEDWVFSTEKTYTFTIIVTDDGGSTKVTATLNSIAFTMHGKPGGDGIAFGKMAELGATESLGGSGVAEFAFEGKFNEPVYGKALGMDRLPAIPADSDFNDYMETGCYAVYSNAIAETVANIPVARAGRLEVWSATGEGVRTEQWSYLRQRFIPYNMGNAVWERELTRGEDNIWNYYDWWKSSLTPVASEKVYSKAAMTIALSTDTTLGVVSTYTKIPLDKNVLSTSDRLTMQDNAIRIGANIQYVKVSGQALVKCGSTAGNRHARIQKISNGTTTSHAWDCVYGAANGNTEFPFTPIIVPVKEGDLLFMVYYTGDATDKNAAGSTANGWQTYLTVEEL